MLLRFIYIFSIFSLLSSSVVGVQESLLEEMSNLNSSLQEHSHIEHNVSHVKGLDCEDCADEDSCHDDDCCHRLCACVSSFVFNHGQKLTSNNRLISINLDWYIYNNYRSPFLDPALKPPLFS